MYETNNTDGHPASTSARSETSPLLQEVERALGELADSNDDIRLAQTFVLAVITANLDQNSDRRAEIVAQLREIYDGSLSKAFGTGKRFEWRGRIRTPRMS